MATGSSYVPPPPARTQVQQIPVQQPVVAQQPAMEKPMMKPSGAGKLIVLGVILFFVGVILVQSTVLLTPPDYDDFDNPDDYYEELDANQNLRRTLFGFGRIINWVGVMIISIPLYILGVTSKGLDWKVKASMLSAATALVIATMIVSMFITLY
jgi:hypothetical protein